MDESRELPSYMTEEDIAKPNPFLSQSFVSLTSRQKEKEPDKYDGKSDLTDYLCHFGKVAKINKWTYTDCGLELAISLMGEARSVLPDLPKLKEDDYLSLVHALIQRFDPPGREYKYSSDFLERCCGPEEDLSEYAHQLRKLARKAYPGITVPDGIIIDVFIRGLPERDMIEHVSLAQPQTLKEAIQIAIRCDIFKKCRKQLNKVEQYVHNVSHRTNEIQDQQHRAAFDRPQRISVFNQNEPLATPAYNHLIAMQNEKKNEAMKNADTLYPPISHNSSTSNSQPLLTPSNTPWCGDELTVKCCNSQKPEHIAVNCHDILNTSVSCEKEVSPLLPTSSIVPTSKDECELPHIKEQVCVNVMKVEVPSVPQKDLVDSYVVPEQRSVRSHSPMAEVEKGLKCFSITNDSDFKDSYGKGANHGNATQLETEDHRRFEMSCVFELKLNYVIFVTFLCASVHQMWLCLKAADNCISEKSLWQKFIPGRIMCSKVPIEMWCAGSSGYSLSGKVLFLRLCDPRCIGKKKDDVLKLCKDYGKY